MSRLLLLCIFRLLIIRTGIAVRPGLPGVLNLALHQTCGRYLPWGLYSSRVSTHHPQSIKRPSLMNAAKPGSHHVRPSVLGRNVECKVARPMDSAFVANSCGGLCNIQSSRVWACALLARARARCLPQNVFLLVLSHFTNVCAIPCTLGGACAC